MLFNFFFMRINTFFGDVVCAVFAAVNAYSGQDSSQSLNMALDTGKKFGSTPNVVE